MARRKNATFTLDLTYGSGHGDRSLVQAFYRKLNELYPGATPIPIPPESQIHPKHDAQTQQLIFADYAVRKFAPVASRARLYHISGWGDLSSAKVGDTFTLKPGSQHAEGLGVYFSEGSPVKITTAEGTAQTGAAAVIETEVFGTEGWWRTKPATARKFNRPVTWHTDGKSLSCEVKSLGIVHVHGAGSLPLLKCDCFFSRTGTHSTVYAAAAQKTAGAVYNAAKLNRNATWAAVNEMLQAL